MNNDLWRIVEAWPYLSPMSKLRIMLIVYREQIKRGISSVVNRGKEAFIK
jgi:hypothetical protein